MFSDYRFQEHMASPMRGAYGNPHSANPASLASTHVAEHVRKYVLEYFNAPPAEYDVIFTQNASGALKIVRSSFTAWG
jgi:selenocysteine lyase/cysteine desulfurase